MITNLWEPIYINVYRERDFSSNQNNIASNITKLISYIILIN